MNLGANCYRFVQNQPDKDWSGTAVGDLAANFKKQVKAYQEMAELLEEDPNLLSADDPYRKEITAALARAREVGLLPPDAAVAVLV
jgi:molybdopterin converting factor small subunit